MHRALSIAAAFAILATSARAQGGGATLSVERIFGRSEFASAPLPDVHWMPDGSSYVETRSAPFGGTDIVRVDAATGRTTVLAPAARVVDERGDPILVEDLSLSADGRKALLFHNSVRVWRRNTRGVYHVIDFATGTVTPISRAPGLQMFAKFSPDGREVAFVRDNDLYVTDLATGRERALTHDGSDVIINGTTDWVYEEELDLRDAFRWSPDSKRIAFWRFDQSNIPVYPLLDDSTLYPRVLHLRYPKAGAPNSSVKIGVVTVATGDTKWMDIGTDTSSATGGYIARVEWMGSDSLTIQRLPRLQNRIDLLMVSATTGGSRLILSERDSAWVEVDGAAPRWVENGTMFLWPSERSGWRRYYLYRRDGTLVRPVTRDSVDASALAGVDDRRGLVYVIQAEPTPMQRQLVRYALRRPGSGTRVTRTAGTHDVSIAPGARYFVDVYTTAATPPVVTLASLPTPGTPRVLEDNAALRATLAQLAIRPPEFFTIPMPDGVMLNAFRIVPADFDSTRKYPVLMYVYGGPGSQTVVDAYGGARYLWHQLLAQRGFVVVSVDNRGTGARGSAFKHVVYRNLGAHESRDQLDAARWLARQPWVDASRIGIWGWSYGGYMAALTSFTGGDLFRAAISVAPVTDWRLYDTIYTERYMGLPADNLEGYRRSAPQNHVRGLTARYLLVHGTGDDNVHPQNSIQLANRLEAAGKLFQMVLYPNRTHSISGGNTQVHLFATLTRFVEEELGGRREEPVTSTSDARDATLPRTRAERTGYAETSHHDDVIAFLDSLHALGGPRWTSIGRTTEGREIPLVVLSRPQVSTPEEARRLGRPIVYVQANIHGGEVEGKEALLALIRDLWSDTGPSVLDSVVLLANPIYNADGNERFAPQARNRGAQNGPELVGQRANAQGFDLNRDYVKAEAPETRASLAALERWDPHVFVDLHTTDGSYHGYALTYSPPLNPAAVFTGPYTRDTLLPELRRRMRERHHVETFDYGNFEHNFVAGAATDTAPQAWSTYEAFPRYGTNYVGLRNRIAILSEAYSHDPFERRVRSTYAFTREILSLVAERGAEIRALRSRADSSVVAWGRAPATAPALPLRSELTRHPRQQVVIAEELARTGDSSLTQPGVRRGWRRTGHFLEVRMPVYDRFDPTLERRLPAAYILGAADSAAVRLLTLHGVRIERLPRAWTTTVQRFTIDTVITARRAFQGHRTLRLEGRWSGDRRTIPAGSYVVPTAQPLGLLAFYLLEPESDDGLATWNVFDAHLTRGGEFPVVRVREVRQQAAESSKQGYGGGGG